MRPLRSGCSHASPSAPLPGGARAPFGPLQVACAFPAGTERPSGPALFAAGGLQEPGKKPRSNQRIQTPEGQHGRVPGSGGAVFHIPRGIPTSGVEKTPTPAKIAAWGPKNPRWDPIPRPKESQTSEKQTLTGLRHP